MRSLALRLIAFGLTCSACGIPIGHHWHMSRERAQIAAVKSQYREWLTAHRQHLENGRARMVRARSILASFIAPEHP